MVNAKFVLTPPVLAVTLNGPASKFAVNAGAVASPFEPLRTDTLLDALNVPLAPDTPVFTVNITVWPVRG